LHYLQTPFLALQSQNDAVAFLKLTVKGVNIFEIIFGAAVLIFIHPILVLFARILELMRYFVGYLAPFTYQATHRSETPRMLYDVPITGAPQTRESVRDSNLSNGGTFGGYEIFPDDTDSQEVAKKIAKEANK
jgi:hypothetical protein